MFLWQFKWNQFVTKKHTFTRCLKPSSFCVNQGKSLRTKRNTVARRTSLSCKLVTRLPKQIFIMHSVYDMSVSKRDVTIQGNTIDPLPSTEWSDRISPYNNRPLWHRQVIFFIMGNRRENLIVNTWSVCVLLGPTCLRTKREFVHPLVRVISVAKKSYLRVYILRCKYSWCILAIHE